MANRHSLPLQEKIHRKSKLKRASDVLILSLLLSLLFYRLLYLRSHGYAWLLAFLCESWFTFHWALTVNMKWNPVEFKTYPDRLLKRFPGLPPVDLFVTTADCSLEPPIVTVNTVLSLLSVDYPADKLACYVSDDGCSPITHYSLVEASKFAKLWAPFCKKYGVQVRAPFMYFSKEAEAPFGRSDSFLHEWNDMKNKYEELTQRIAGAFKKSVPSHLPDEFNDFVGVERGNHPSIVKVIWENEEKLPDGVPHLVYVAREKRPKHPQHFKAGAMNVLTRVSGVMTNAPFMMNVDCDMFANNPQIVLQAMCLLLGSNTQRESGFVQCPQLFYGGLKDDPFGNQMIVSNEFSLRGIAGLQGPLYVGTGCFHRRKTIYGLPPDDEDIKEKFGNRPLQKLFGHSEEFVNSAARIMSGKHGVNIDGLSSSVKTANEVAACCYESDTCWGAEVGWMYGSATEDVLTGLRIHSMGWGSIYCTPEPPAFLGCAPMSGPVCLTQMKRWAMGLLEILVGSHSPIRTTLTESLNFRQCLAYVFATTWPLNPLPEICYAALPAYCILTNTYFLPKVSEPWMLVPAMLFIFGSLYSLMEYRSCGLSVRNWWNNQRMQRINMATGCLFGILGVVLKLLGLSQTMFELTPKEQNAADAATENRDIGRFTFDASPIFIPCTALVLVHLAALVVSLFGMQPAPVIAGHGSGLAELVCSIWVLLSFMPFVQGLFRKGNYGIPWPIIWKAMTLASFFFCICSRL